MNPLLASARIVSGLDPVERALLSFEQEWRKSGDLRLEQYWPDRCQAEGISPGESTGMLAELIKADLRLRFDNGQSPTVASYLEQFPELSLTHGRVVSLIYEEFCLMEERGRAPDVKSFCDRYPRWKDSLAAQLQYHRLFSLAAGTRPAAPRFPNAGDCFEEFQLVSLLGRGGTSRVFLARDLSLGGKQVVLKVSLDRGDEPRIHGRLDHPHIVPANSVAFQPDTHLRGLSMPYHPGLALDVVLSRLNSSGRPRKAIELWHVLVDGAAKSLISSADSQKESLLVAEMRRAGPRGDGWEGFPVRGTFAQGAAWLAMIVARALHYAHGMGTYHRDVKPGNVLLTLRYGPQLFDFNLSESPHSAHQAQEAIHGGTLPYMAPEQIEAFLNPELWGKVNAQADVYSLGLVLRELLTGQMPELPDEKLSPARAMRQVLDRRALLDTHIRAIDSSIPHALESIVAKSLAFAPGERYADAESLAKDLERFLKRQPLLQADNRSRKERIANWVVRNRLAIFGLTTCVLLVVGLVHRPLAYRLRPPVESLPVFQSSIGLLDEDEFSRAASALQSLLPSYSDDPLVLSYLAFAFDGQVETQAADDNFRQAISLPDCDRKLLDWGSKNPELPFYLENFAETRIREAEKQVAPEVFCDDEEQHCLEGRRDSLALADRALTILGQLGRDSQELDRLKARAEEFNGDYSAAYARLSRSIEAASRTEDSANAPDDNLGLNALFACHASRCRVAVRQIDRPRRDGSLSDPKAALALLRNAEEQDLKFCGDFLATRYVTGAPKFRKFELLKNRLWLQLTRGELELDLGMLSAAREHLLGKHGARELRTAVSKAATDSGEKAPKMERLTQRLQHALNRLNAQDASRTAGEDAGESRASDDRNAAG